MSAEHGRYIPCYQFGHPRRLAYLPNARSQIPSIQTRVMLNGRLLLDSDDDDELPSPSQLVRKNPVAMASQTLLRVKVRMPKVADDDIDELGSAGRSSCKERFHTI